MIMGNFNFDYNAPMSDIQLYGSYSRKINGEYEDWIQICDRVLYGSGTGLFDIGNFTTEEKALIQRTMAVNGHQSNAYALGSARALWCMGTPWLKDPDNWYGLFNCSTRRIETLDDLSIMMDLAMMGSGTGVVLEPEGIKKLPKVANKIALEEITEIVPVSQGNRDPDGGLRWGYGDDDQITIVVGDSRQGWVKAYRNLLYLSFQYPSRKEIRLTLDFSNVRPKGEPVKGFGGTANPNQLPESFVQCINILNSAIGRQLTSLEVCLLIDWPADAIVAGGIRRTAGMRQALFGDPNFDNPKDGMWQEDEQGNWRLVQPEKKAMVRANHTLTLHRKPSLEECVDAVRKQYSSGEGALQFVPEAIARANADILHTRPLQEEFINLYCDDKKDAEEYLKDLLTPLDLASKAEIKNRMGRYGLNPCGELIAENNLCNLSTVPLTNIDPLDLQTQEEAFSAASLHAAALLERNFTDDKFAFSRDIDPIVIVSFTGAFDFFVRLFGPDWVRWWMEGRPKNWGENTLYFPLGSTYSDFEEPSARIMPKSSYFRLREQEYLSFWKDIVFSTVWRYCDRNGLRRPNRCTGLKPEGSLTLLSGVGCCGWAPPKFWTYLRRKEFPVNHPVALAAMDYGYKIIPGRYDLDEDGKMLNDPFHPNCTEWLVEVPVMERVAKIHPELLGVDIDKVPALAQLDFYMQVQKHYTTHNTSGTLQFSEAEIMPVASEIHRLIQENEGYISIAMLNNDYEIFPRMPFEPIPVERYQEEAARVLKERKSENFYALLLERDSAGDVEQGPLDAACESEICQLR